MFPTRRLLQRIPSIPPKFWSLPNIHETGVGLAISGGADSIALAYLCKNGAPVETAKKLVAFVVDHGLRPGSDTEAEAVKSRVENTIGIRTHVLRADCGPASAAPTRLETVAREARYKALGRACAAHGLPYLFLGHHGDDSYETALFRLGGRARFKLGMEEGPGDIPECTGLHGVHRSGAPTVIRAGRDVLEFEGGGVRVARPLLGWDKEDLVQVCKERGLEWVEDPTNRLTTLTFRNAIRGHLTADVLPEALRKENVLEVVRNGQRAFEEHREAAERLFKKAAIHYDPYLGKLAVSLPSQATIWDAMGDLQPSSTLLVLSMFVRRLAEFVSPLDGVQLSQAANAAEAMFGLGQQVLPTENCNVGGIIFQRSGKGGRQPIEGSVWTLKRQGISRGEMKRAYGEKGTFAERWIVDVPGRPDDARSELHRLEASAGATPTKEFIPQPGDLKLWDNRIWLAVSNPTPHALRIEPLSKDLVAAFGELMRKQRVAVRFTDRRRSRGGRTIASFRVLLRALGGLRPGAPPDVVPVITCADEYSGKPRILAFPSLEMMVVRGAKGRDGDVPAWAAEVSWAVRHRRVDCEEEQLKRMVRPGGDLDDFRSESRADFKPSFKRVGIKREKVRPVKMFDRPAVPLFDKGTPLYIKR